LIIKIKFNHVPSLSFKMDFLREIVGGPKNRYREKGYNLDLTYITPRIIAMAFPASGIEKLYRNSIDTIAELLEN
jgi:phosphatidylinositol-3,4,5-trisphosphate 3-phosphatase and dual-specificity protein phosphatase PTEN